MLLDRHDAASLLGRGENHVLCQRLYREDVDDLGGNTSLCKDVRRSERLGDLDATGEDGDVCSLAQHARVRQAANERFVIDLRHLVATHAHVDGARRGGSNADGGLCGAVVRRHQDAHVGKRPHHANVLEHLVRRAVLAHRDARMRGAHLHVKVGIAYGVPNLVIAAANAKHGKGRCKRDSPRKGEARCHANHVLLGNAHVHKAVWVSLLQLVGGCGSREVRVDRADVHALVGQLDERLAKGLACCPLAHG